MNESGKDLRKEPPRSPRQRLGGYVVLARTIDKCRAKLAGTAGEYHFDCPLDQTLFSFIGTDGAAFERQVAKAGDDDRILEWIASFETQHTPEEIKLWSDGVERSSLMENPAKREWFSGECRKLGLDPDTTTLFDWLEADDRASFAESDG